MHGRNILIVLCALLVLQFELKPVYSAPLVDRTELASKREFLELMNDGNSTTMCTICALTVDSIKLMLSLHVTEDCLAKFASTVCKVMQLQLPYACDRIVKVFQEEVLYLFRNTVVKPVEICGLLSEECGDPVNPFGQLNWTMPIPDDKPPVTPFPTADTNPVRLGLLLMPTGLLTADEETLRVLHLADIHIDYNYTVGTEAECGGPLTIYPMCCKPYPGESTNASIKVPAGKWGHTGDCDLPYWTVIHTFEHLRQTEKFDYIIWTGDLMDHSIWDYDRQRHEFILRNFTDMLLQYFPGTPIYSSMGNHEGVPLDNFAPHSAPLEFQPTWVYKIFAETWGNWVNDYDSQRVIRYRGSFSVEVMPGLRVISLNTVYGYNSNMLVYLDQEDPDGTLQWLASELLRAEKSGEKVQIIGHIPSGSTNTHKFWTANYYKIVNRFESTIVGVFAGHTHNDEFNIFYENGDPRGRATAVTYISPSLTTHTNVRPAYRVYTINKKNFQMQEIEAYVLNVTEANESGSPKWKLSYKATEEYGLKDLSPASWNSLVLRLIADPELLQKYLVNYYRRDLSDLNCGHECAKKRLCEIRTAKSGSPELCETIGELENYKPAVSSKREVKQRLSSDEINTLLSIQKQFEICKINTEL